MKKLLLIQITILMSAFSFAKIEVLDRVAIIVDEGVVMESQIKDLIQTTKLRSIEQGMQPVSYTHLTLPTMMSV